MTPAFSEILDPVFLYVIDLLERINQHRAAAVAIERQQVRRRLDEALQKLGGRRESVLAGQALIYWIDEMLILTDWEGQDWWNNNKLETEILDTNNRYRNFFVDAKESAGLADKSALEVYYLCVALGFRGLYRDPKSDDSMNAREMLQLPPTLQEWLQQAYAGIRLVPPPDFDGQREPIEGVYPLEGPVTLIWASFFGLILLVLATVFGYLYFHFPK
ncbi:MAG: DotU family type IV/VI secretion system protein [Planctomycetota bacterium]